MKDVTDTILNGDVDPGMMTDPTTATTTHVGNDRIMTTTEPTVTATVFTTTMTTRLGVRSDKELVAVPRIQMVIVSPGNRPLETQVEGPGIPLN